MNPSLESALHSISYEEYLRMKTQVPPQHQVREFLDSFNGKTPEEVQQFIQSPVTVYPQRSHYIYMDSTDIAGSLLELARPINSGMQQQTINQGATVDQQIPVHHAQVQQGHHIELPADHQVKMQTPLGPQSPTEGHSTSQPNASTTPQERRQSSSGVSQPVKKRKFDLPLEESYTLNPVSVQNAVSTTLTLPTEAQRQQQQAYIPVRQELLTVDNSHLYGLVPSTTVTGGRLPNVESWAVYSTHAACPETQALVHTSVSQDGCSIVQMGEIPLTVTPVKIEDSKERVQTDEDSRKNIQEKIVQTSVASPFPVHFVNVNGNVHIPITVQTSGRAYPPIKCWDQQTLQPQVLQQHVAEQPVPVQIEQELPSTLKPEEGASVWKMWAQVKNEELLKEAEKRPMGSGRRKPMQFREDVLSVSIAELNYGLCLMTKEARKPDGSSYEADTLYYLFLCIQKYMFDNDRIDNVFADLYYSKFLEKLHDVLKDWAPAMSPLGYIIPSCISEDMLWECKQLGAHSPSTLLFTLMYFNTKYFMLKTVEQHSQLAFSKILKQTRKNPGNGKDKYSTVRFLRLYGQIQVGQKALEETYVEQPENPDNPLQCPIKLYDFYRFKCPQGARGPSDAFYLIPEPVVAPNSPIWYSAQPVNEELMQQMLTRILMIREVQEMHAASDVSSYQ